MKYNEAKSLLTTARNPENGKPLANNTRLFDRGAYYAIRLHSTDIIRIYPDGSYTLHTGGWHTVTTKQRLNKYLPGLGLYQHDWTWHVGDGSHFEEGMKYDGRELRDWLR